MISKNVAGEMDDKFSADMPIILMIITIVSPAETTMAV